MDERTVAWDVMGTLFDVSPVAEAMPRLLHAAAALQLAGRFVPLPRLVESLLGPEALETFASLEPCADAAPALQLVADAGARNVTLTNGSRENTETLLERAGLRHLFAELLTVEQVSVYKPAREPYGLVDATSTVLVAAHDWDVAGAREAGLRAIFVDRDGRGWRLPLPEPESAPSLVAAAQAAVG